MKRAALIFPHQLFSPHPALEAADIAVMVEDPLFFRQYPFHRQKLLFHRVSMRRYAESLKRDGFSVHYVESDALKETGDIAVILRKLGVEQVSFVDPCDDWLATRLQNALASAKISSQTLEDSCFLTPRAVIDAFVAGRKRFFFTDFYIAQRKRLGILIDRAGKPEGGQWSFDPENRKRLPRGFPVPDIAAAKEDACVRASRDEIRQAFPRAPGADEPFIYPTDPASARAWLTTFIRERLPLFGDYEDAMSREHDVLFHSVLTPMLNVGLLTPREVVDAALAARAKVPLNALEGFIRQVIGWREFVRLVYLARGRRQRTRNFWKFEHAMPKALYDGTTGIDPVDHVIRQVLRTGYCHHIERLMILGNFMLLCEIRPDAIYQWFMELFIDAYDWVMVPNIYGMSQHADGGLMTTKPYISGSSYVLKMSDHPKGDWCPVWDALYWRFIHRHADFFAGNPRMAVMVKVKDKLGDRLQTHLRVAEDFLRKLHGA